jgi:peptidoglycan/xylan/chitin deacetylase (PgdA/CDA1 family)
VFTPADRRGAGAGDGSVHTVTLARVRKGLADRLTRTWAFDARPSQATRPLASFTFDDFPRSALLNGGRLLREHGARGTFFVSGGFERRIVDGVRYFDAEDLGRAAEDGHELGCHTFEHLRLPFVREAEVVRSLEANALFVRAAAPGAGRLQSFAYPYGHVNLARKRLLARRFAACRGIWPGVNAGRIDFAQLKAVPLEMNSLGRLDVDAYVEQAARTCGWLVFFTHDVSESPSAFGYPTAELARLIDRVQAHGLTVLPLREAAAEVRGAPARTAA